MSLQDAQKALAMIERARKQGRASEVKLTRVTPGYPGGYNPDTGEFDEGSDPVVTTYAAPGLKVGYKQSDNDGTLIKQGDQKLYVPAFGFIRPVTDEKVLVGSTSYSIVSVEVVAPGDTDILYILQIRGM